MVALYVCSVFALKEKYVYVHFRHFAYEVNILGRGSFCPSREGALSSPSRGADVTKNRVESLLVHVQRKANLVQRYGV